MSMLGNRRLSPVAKCAGCVNECESSGKHTSEDRFSGGPDG